MKKNLLIIAFVAVAVAALGFAGLAFAQQQAEPYSYGPGYMFHSGTGMTPQRGHGMAGGMAAGHPGMEALHAYMYPAMAEALGLSVDDFTARHDSGETFWDIAESLGLTADEAWNVMQQARSDALAQAVADGVITEAFAGQMLSHMGQMQGEGFPESGPCHQDGGYGPRGMDF